MAAVAVNASMASSSPSGGGNWPENGGCTITWQGILNFSYYGATEDINLEPEEAPRASECTLSDYVYRELL